MSTIKLELNEMEIEILKGALNKQCAFYISESVDITHTDEKKATYERLYNKACILRNKVYDEVFVK